MIRHTAVLCVVALSVTASCAPSESASYSSADRAAADDPADAFVITGARVFDGEEVHTGVDVLVEDGLIRTVGDASIAPGDVPRIDGTGATLLPGLIDAHTHTREVAQLQRDERFGVTTVLDMFTLPENDSTLRRASRERHDVAGFFSSGVLATAPGGHGTESNPDIPTVAGPEDAASFVADRVAGGADYLKVVLNGQRAARGMPTLDEETVRALVEAAKSDGLLVVAHIETPQDAYTAGEAGVDGVAHVWRTPGVPDGLPERLASRGVFVVPTLSVVSGLDHAARVALVEDPAVRPYPLEIEASVHYITFA